MTTVTVSRATMPSKNKNRKPTQPWERGKVPAGYWDKLENRRRYMRWLGRQLGYLKREDWYQLTKQDFHANAGGGLLANYFGDSPQTALAELYPNSKWYCWLFRSTPQGFWQDVDNRMEYLDWLGKKLGFRTDEDWYRVTRADFHTNFGGGMLANYYGDSVFKALNEYRPKMKWQVWLFRTVPQGYWKSKENRILYLKWLGKKVGFRRQNDWYKLTKNDFARNQGEGLFMTHYNGSRRKVLEELYPTMKIDADKLRRNGRPV